MTELPSCPIDLARLATIAQASQRAPTDIVSDFLRSTDKDAAVLHELVRQSEFLQVGQQAHRIKGACLMLGAHELSEACSLLALASRGGDEAAAVNALRFFDLHMQLLVDSLRLHLEIADPPSPPIATDMPLLACEGIRFLVVEDHEFQRKLIGTLLTRLGAQDVHCVADGSTAMSALADGSRPVDIAVLDLAMPGIDGMELMRALCAAGNSTALIVNSALSPSLLASLIQVAKSYKLNLLGVVSKPLTPKLLAPLLALYRGQHPLPLETA